MATIKVRMLYDFEGDSSGGELTVAEGDLLTVTSQDVGDGWWEGQTASGEVGLFPEAYAELINDSSPAAAAPPAYQQNGYPDNSYQQSYDQQGYGQQGYGDQSDNQPEYDYNQDDSRQRADSFDDQWDDNPGTTPAINITSSDSTAYDGGAGDPNTLSVSPRQRMDSSAGIQRSGTIRKNINRFSTFVKSGGEDYLLGKTSKKANVTDKDQVAVQESTVGPQWVASPEPYSLTCTEPTKKSKLKGIKSFIAYRITPTSTNIPVERRYKHFDWLHDRMMEKFTLLSVPPLPDKQYAGRYGEEFVEKRRERLEKWLNRVARHPVLSRSDVFMHFLTCRDEKDWKAGKRRAEKDELIGSTFFVTVSMPQTLQVTNAENEVDRFGKFVRSMEDNTVKMKERFQEHCEKSSGSFKREYQKIGQVFTRLGETFATEERDYARGVTEAFSQTGKMYDEIGVLYEDQPKNDLLPMLDVLREYLGILSTYPDIVEVHKEAVTKVSQCKKMVEEEKMMRQDLVEVESRADILSSVTLAEINHFHSERVIDMKEAGAAFLRSQIKFHQDIIERLQMALGMYEQ